MTIKNTDDTDHSKGDSTKESSATTEVVTKKTGTITRKAGPVIKKPEVVTKRSGTIVKKAGNGARRSGGLSKKKGEVDPAPAVESATTDATKKNAKYLSLLIINTNVLYIIINLKLI